MRQTSAAPILALVIGLVAPHVVVGQPASDSLHALFAEAWANELASWPLFATSVGVHDYNDRLPDVSPEAYAARTEVDRDALDRLLSIDRSALDDGDKLNYDLFEHRLEQRLSSGRFLQPQ